MDFNGKVYLGGDRSSHKLKAELKAFFQERGIDFMDLGLFDGDTMEYPDIAREVAEQVSEQPGSFGVLVFGKIK